MVAGLTRAATDIAFEPERYFPRFAAGAQERRGKFCSSGGQRLSITAERRRDLLDRGRKRRFVHRNELAVADDGTPTDQHCLDRPSDSENTICRAALLNGTNASSLRSRIIRSAIIPGLIAPIAPARPTARAPVSVADRSA